MLFNVQYTLQLLVVIFSKKELEISSARVLISFISRVTVFPLHSRGVLFPPLPSNAIGTSWPSADKMHHRGSDWPPVIVPAQGCLTYLPV